MLEFMCLFVALDLLLWKFCLPLSFSFCGGQQHGAEEEKFFIIAAAWSDKHNSLCCELWTPVLGYICLSVGC